MNITDALSQLFTQEGGLSGLKKQFEEKNLGAVVQSWIGSGANLPITIDQLKHVFGEDKVAALAQKAGMTPEELQQKLSTALPELVNKLTPDGKISSESFSLKNLMNLGQSLLTKH